MINKTVLLSGRFDPPHLGHVITMMRLGQQYKKVLVVILDHKEQRYPLTYRKKVIGEALSMAKGNYEVKVNKIHFGKITLKQIQEYNFNVYAAAANYEVLLHIESLGIPAIYLERAYDFAASDTRKLEKITEAFK